MHGLLDLQRLLGNLGSPLRLLARILGSGLIRVDVLLLLRRGLVRDQDLRVVRVQRVGAASALWAGDRAINNQNGWGQGYKQPEQLKLLAMAKGLFSCLPLGAASEDEPRAAALWCCFLMSGLREGTKTPHTSIHTNSLLLRTYEQQITVRTSRLETVCPQPQGLRGSWPSSP